MRTLKTFVLYISRVYHGLFTNILSFVQRVITRCTCKLIFLQDITKLFLLNSLPSGFCSSSWDTSHHRWQERRGSGSERIRVPPPGGERPWGASPGSRSRIRCQEHDRRPQWTFLKISTDTVEGRFATKTKKKGGGVKILQKHGVWFRKMGL